MPTTFETVCFFFNTVVVYAGPARLHEEEGAEASRPRQDPVHKRSQEPVHHPQGAR